MSRGLFVNIAHLLWILLLIPTNTLCHKAESDEQTDQTNTTTLYPISNTSTSRTAGADRNESVYESNKSKLTDATAWKIETAFGESKLVQKDDTNVTESKEISEQLTRSCDKCSNFKPSQHLSTFFDKESFEVITTPSNESFTPLRNPAAFVSSPKDEFQSNSNKIPTDVLRNYEKFPYKFESTFFTNTKANRQPATLDSKPTAQVPVSVPAGGLYKLPGAFKEKPGLSGDDEEFGLEFNGDIKETAIKKRVNPWKNLLRLVTAFIPVGLIISALTPSVITIHSTENHSSPNLYRRVDPLPPAISERCRRRLLCELHADTNYAHERSRRRSQCYKLRCDNERALHETLRWVLDHHRYSDQHNVGHYN